MESKFILVLLSLCALRNTATASLSYDWPDRSLAVLEIKVQDIDTGSSGIQGIAQQYTDYKLGYQRVDELWDAVSLVGTPFGALGLRSDQHLMSATEQHFSYFNASGGACATLPFGFLPRDLYSSANYAGVTELDGVPANTWKVSQSIVGLQVNITFWAETTGAQLPLLRTMEGPPGSPLEFNSARYLMFSPQNQSFPESLFDKPLNCKSRTLRPLSLHFAAF